MKERGGSACRHGSGSPLTLLACTQGFLFLIDNLIDNREITHE